MQADSCNNVAMPNIDEAAKKWQLDLAKRFGDAVKKCRTDRKLTAQQLADRTREVGYPVTRVAISKIESNSRAGKVDVAELLALATALNVPPVTLLFPHLPDGIVQYAPGIPATSEKGMEWFGGEWTFFWSFDGDVKAEPAPLGQVLRATRERSEARKILSDLVRKASSTGPDDDPDAQRRAELYEREIHYAELRINQLNDQIRDAGGTVNGGDDA
ncbi:helix-turn-helix protein [Mycolicibacterium chlorophenolicum]|uniref:Helix-turn-helix protein n=2 Tax=Mycolicibacterium chlorophenolicum TaxID=37916 RepID=A0A0J6VIL6_9MYCO|nr:helix-turn-helix protein [Mycolicibacterium chlorophenolicum]